MMVWKHFCLLLLLATVNGQVLQPAPVSCNAAFSAPCARTNSQWLASTVAGQLLSASTTSEVDRVLKEINSKRYNRDTGFYPFVFDRNTALCVAHGGNAGFVGQTLPQIFESVGITYADADALHERFQAADSSWVRYLWSDNGRVNSKLAFVVNVSNTHYVGVGYENTPLPEDVPCSSDYDSWCSLNNVRSLVGRAQFQLSQAHSLAAFEESVYQISFEEEFKIPGGFYLFMYNFEGELKAHGVLRDSFGKTLQDILPSRALGTAQDGASLHRQFVTALNNEDAAWVQYQWRNSLDEPPYTKIGFLVKIEFGGDQYYLGAGFTSQVRDYLTAPLGAPCSEDYNLPCSFHAASQLSSHSESHAISSPLTVQDRFTAISRSDSFKHEDFYVFVYHFDNVCVAHGRNEEFVGLSLNQILEDSGINLNGRQLHEQFRTAAEQGGGWISYTWKNPGDTKAFEKISYIFHVNIDGEDYYGGVGFNHKQAPFNTSSVEGTKKNGDPILCSPEYGLNCSEVIARTILGQAVAELILGSSESSSVTTDGLPKTPIEDVLAQITAQGDGFGVNNFTVSVFSFGDNPECETNDGSGCAVAYGANPDYQGYTWNEILELEEVSTIPGASLHQQLIDNSNFGGGAILYPFRGTSKRAWTARFRHEGEYFYAMAEYQTTDRPETCDACSKGTRCTWDEQEFCAPIADKRIYQRPPFIVVLVLFALGIPFALASFLRQKHRHRMKRRAIEEKVREMATRLEQQMQGIYQVVQDMPMLSIEEYKIKVGVDEADKFKRKETARWYWHEDDSRVGQHIDEMVLKDTNFVSYSGEICGQIEHAFKLYEEGRGFKEFRIDLTNKITSTTTGEKLANSHSGNFYEINFETMKQSNSKTGYARSVIRQEVRTGKAHESFGDFPFLPEGIDFTGEDKENLLPTYTGQIIQVSKFHPSNEWMFGNVLYDPLVDDAVQASRDDSGDGLNAVLAAALRDRPTSGWLPRCVTSTADVNHLHKLLKKIGSEGSDTLATPPSWERSGEVRIPVREGSEYNEVVQHFKTALYGQRDKVDVVSVNRIENVPLWQSYAVRMQAMKTRYSSGAAERIHNTADASLESLECRWLFHGSHPDAIPKIEKQGFNRSFAGKNALRYGRGVYFARDASYSCHPTYSVPDSKGIQHMFLCRVSVGDWSKGSYDQITPEPKPNKQFELFDSTVDNVANPSIFVIYHDAQCYPEYLVSFRKRKIQSP